MFLMMTLVPFLVLRLSKFILTTTFSCFCSRIRLTADVRTIGGGRPGLAGAAASRGVASVWVESVSMSDAWTGAKKFRVATSFVGVSTAVQAAFFQFGALSCVLYPLRLRISLKPSSCIAPDFGVLDWPAGVLSFCTANVYVPYRALNRFFPLRTLQKFCLFSSAVLMMVDHCSLSPTEAGVYLAISSMSRITLSSCFSCALASGNCLISC
jgi:hypothetical protein